ERLAGGGSVAGEARVIDRDRRFRERKRRQREVLRELEPQMRRRLSLFRALGEVERARIAARDATRLTENHLEQREEIALRGKRRADARQLGELTTTLVAL